MHRINIIDCEFDDAETEARGEFAHRARTVTETLGTAWIGATVYEVPAGRRRGPYHFHHGVEEWMYVIAGSPIHRDRTGERTLSAGQLVAFAAGPAGAHTVSGPGRVAIFSVGATGWGEAFVTVYEDADTIAAAPGVKFRRGDALELWDATAPPPPSPDAGPPTEAGGCPILDLSAAEQAPGSLTDRLGARTWEGELLELRPGQSSGPLVHDWCRESVALVLAGTPALRHAGGRAELGPGDLVGFPQGPDGARAWGNDGDQPARLLVMTTPSGRPFSRFFPDDGTVDVEVPGFERARFRLADQILDDDDGEPGAGPAPG